MRRKLAGPLAFVLLFAGFTVLVAWMLYQDTAGGQLPAPQVALVVYGDSAERWHALELGVSQACEEQGIELPALILAGTEGAEEQKRLIQREIDRGAKGLLVAAADSVALREWLEEVDFSVPVVLVETGAGEALPCVRPDDAAMGRALAEPFAQSGKEVAILAQGAPRQSVAARRAGFLQRAEELGVGVVELQNPKPEEPLRQSLAVALATQRPETLVLFDNESLEAAIDALPAAMVEVDLSGVGVSSKAIHATDSGLVTQLCFVNEYAMGYTAVGQLAGRLGLLGAPTTPPEPVRHLMANRENMFTQPTEQLLFQAIL